MDAVGVRAQAAQVDPDVPEDRARLALGGRAAGQGDVPEPQAHRVRRSPADDLHHRVRLGRQVGQEQVQLGGGDRGVGRVGALAELVHVDAPLPQRGLQPGDDRLTVGVGGAHGRRPVGGRCGVVGVGHGPGP